MRLKNSLTQNYYLQIFFKMIHFYDDKKYFKNIFIVICRKFLYREMHATHILIKTDVLIKVPLNYS